MAEEFVNPSNLPLEGDFILPNLMHTDLSEYRECVETAHLVIYADMTHHVMNAYNPRAAVLMIFRFDASIKFLGGIVASGECPEDTINRELIEESNLQPSELYVTDDDLINIHHSPPRKLFHLFAKKVPLATYLRIEKNILEGSKWGDESMGIVRVPLYTMSDNYKGFPAFLNSVFVDNTKKQLLFFLQSQGLMTRQEIKNALNAAPLRLPSSRKPSITPDYIEKKAYTE